MELKHNTQPENTKKRSNKLLFKSIKIVITVWIAVWFIISLPWLLISCFGMLGPQPLTPQEKYGEFPFELTYKIDGEIITIQDIYICKYAGVGWNQASGKYRKWNGYIKGSGEPTIFITEDSDGQIFCFVVMLNFI